MDPNKKYPDGFPYYFDRGMAFPDIDMMKHTLHMGMHMRPVHVPYESTTYLHSIVATYNNELKQQQARILALERESRRLNMMVNYLSRYLPQNAPAREFPPPAFFQPP